MTSVIEYWKAQTRELTRLYNEKEREVEQVVRHFVDQSEELKSKQAIIDGLEFEIEDLQTQIARLRELVADAIPLIWLGNVDCSGCLHMRECYAGEATDFAPENCRLVVRARELGIEEKPHD